MPRIASTTRTSDSTFAYDFPVPSSSSIPSPTHRPPDAHHLKHRRLSPSPITPFAHKQRAYDLPSHAYQRPRWEMSHCYDACESDDDDAFLSSMSMNMSATRRHRDSMSTYRTYGCAYSPPTSIASEDTMIEEDDIESSFYRDQEKERERGRWSPVLAPRRRWRDEDREQCIARIDKVEEDQENEQPNPNEQDEHTPTCTEGLRRQWQSMYLSFQFGVFRARRRVRQTIYGR